MIIVVILIIAALLRLFMLGRTELWYDEAFTGMLTYADKAEFWKIISNEQSPPVYYLLIKGWTIIFGHSDLALRSLSLIFGLLIIYLLYLISQKLFNKQTAYVVATIAAFNPFLIEYSMEARTYTLYGFFVLLGFFSLISRKSWIFLVSLVCLSLMHFVAIFYALILLVCYIYLSWKDKKLAPALGIAGLIILLYVGIVYYAVSKIYYVTQMGWIRKVEPANITRSISAYTYGVKSKLPGSDEINDISLLNLNTSQLSWAFTVLLIIGFVAVLYKIYDERDRNLAERLGFISALYLGPQIALIFLGTFTKYNIYVERYLFPSSLFFILFLGLLLHNNLRFKYQIIPVAVYIVTTLFITKPNYYSGMRELYSNYKNYDGEVVFTSPVDYTIGRFYFRNAENVKLLDPRDPGNTYAIWAFIRPDFMPKNLDKAILISPDPKRIPVTYGQIKEVGSYSVYSKAVVE